MASILAYFLGIITVLIIFISFWLLAKKSSKVRQVYGDIFCNSI